MKRLMQTTAMLAALGAGIGAAQAAGNPDYGACDTNYKAVDTDGDGTVTRQEAQKAAEYEFGRLDRDGNGEISRTEWKNCSGVVFLKQAFKNGDGDRSTGTQASADTEAGGTQGSQSNSGDQTAMNDSASGSTSTSSSKAGTLPTIGEYTEKSFGDADTDKSGDVDRDEAAAWAQKSFHDREDLSKQALRDQKSGDTKSGDTTGADHSGNMQASVSGTGNGAGASGEEQAARIGGNVFASMDTDHNGRVSREEWTKQDGQHDFNRFSAMDKDHNGILSENEWSSAMADSYTQAQNEAKGQPVTVWEFWYFM